MEFHFEATWWKGIRAAALLGAGFLVASSAHAIPKLQLYVEGATYDATTETWIGTPDSNGLIHLWTIGASNGQDADGDDSTSNILDVRLSILFDTPAGAANLNIPVTSAGLVDDLGFSHSWDAGDIGVAQTRTALPKFGDGNPTQIVTADDNQVDIGSADDMDCSQPGGNDCTPWIVGDITLKTLAPHGEFRNGKSWGEWQLEDFLFDTGNLVAIDDFNGSGIPSPGSQMGLIYAYTIDVNPFLQAGETINWHFDLYGALDNSKKGTQGVVDDKDKPVFAPFSHDAGGTGGNGEAPEPGTLLLLGLGLIGAGGLRAIRGGARRTA